MTDIGEIWFLPTLMDALAREAPQVTISTVRNTAVNLRDAMEAGQVDLALGLLPQLKAGFFQRPLFSQRYVCLMRRDHALSRAPLTLDAFSAAEHVVVMSAGTGHGRVDALLDRQGIARRIRLRLPHFVAVGHILAASDMIATVPARFADKICRAVRAGCRRAPGEAAGNRHQPVLAHPPASGPGQSLAAGADARALHGQTLSCAIQARVS